MAKIESKKADAFGISSGSMNSLGVRKTDSQFARLVNPTDLRPETAKSFSEVGEPYFRRALELTGHFIRSADDARLGEPPVSNDYRRQVNKLPGHVAVVKAVQRMPGNTLEALQSVVENPASLASHGVSASPSRVQEMQRDLGWIEGMHQVMKDCIGQENHIRSLVLSLSKA